MASLPSRAHDRIAIGLGFGEASAHCLSQFGHAPQRMDVAVKTAGPTIGAWLRFLHRLNERIELRLSDESLSRSPFAESRTYVVPSRRSPPRDAKS